ncbi:hypothetical protein D3C72_2338630 [compost metagenome]
MADRYDFRIESSLVQPPSSMNLLALDFRVLRAIDSISFDGRLYLAKSPCERHADKSEVGIFLAP